MPQGKKFIKSVNYVYAPVSGDIIPIEQVSDPMIAAKAFGDGVCILNDDASQLYAPCRGEIVFVHSNGHAVIIKGQQGVQILVHLSGLDFAKYNSEVLVLAGQTIKEGEPIATFASKDDTIFQPSRDIHTMVVVNELGLANNKIKFFKTSGKAKAGQHLLYVVGNAVAIDSESN